MIAADNQESKETKARRQFTIDKQVSRAGQGLHSGSRVQITLKPLPAGRGINFARSGDCKQEWIKACPENVVSTRRGVVLGAPDKQGEKNQIRTVEHLLAACAGLQIDNLLVEVQGGEIPVGDGSAAELVELIESAGRQSQQARIDPFVPEETIVMKEDNNYIMIKPARELSYHYLLDYEQDPPGQQKCSFFPSRQSFAAEIAPARTFVLRQEIQALRRAGLGQGGSRDNVVVYGREGPESKLRFANEAARHKLLDLLGDLFLAGPIRGRVLAVKSGHSLHQRAARKIFQLKQKEDKHE